MGKNIEKQILVKILLENGFMKEGGNFIEVNESCGNQVFCTEDLFVKVSSDPNNLKTEYNTLLQLNNRYFPKPIFYEGYAKDKNNIYLFQGFEGGRFFNIFEEKELVQYHMIDKETFESIGKYYFKDKNNIYFIASYNIWDSIGIIKGADSKTFQVLGEGRAKDKNNNYLNGEIKK